MGKAVVRIINISSVHERLANAGHRPIASKGDGEANANAALEPSKVQDFCVGRWPGAVCNTDQ